MKMKLKKQIPEHFNSWLAGVIDGDGNFDFRRGILRSVRIKVHIRDVRILKRIQNMTHVGRIRTVNATPYVMYIASSKQHMSRILTCVNGHIRVKIPSFEKACNSLNIHPLSAPQLKPYDAYLAGLIDSDGSVALNFQQNCITVAVEINMSPYVENLNIDLVIPYAKPNVVVRTTASGKKSIRFIYQAVHSMAPVYDYFTRVRLYSDFKFYRITCIKRFLMVRQYKSCKYGSIEYRIFSEFCYDFIMYQNPQWAKVPFVAMLDKHIVHRHTTVR
jgi:hypothetical protein